MNENYTKEIDLFDLFIDWLSHWKSLIAIVILGVLLAGGYMYKGHVSAGESEQEVADNFLDNLEDGTLLSSLTVDQLKLITVRDMEKYFLSEKDIIAVEEVIAIYDEYKENLEEYDDKKNELEIADRAESFNYIANTKAILEGRKGALSADQQIYYYAKLGVSTVAGGDNLSTSDDEKDGSDNVVVTNTSSKKKAVLIVILMFIFHFIVVACRYIFSNTIKHSDNVSDMANVPEYTRIIDWEKIYSEKGISRLVNKLRFGKLRKTPLNDVVEINASVTIEKLENKNYNSVAVVGVGLEDERKMLVHQIENDSENIVVKSIDSITHSVNGSDDIAGVDAAILVIRVGYSRINDFNEELKSLKDRDVDVIGIAVFE